MNRRCGSNFVDEPKILSSGTKRTFVPRRFIMEPSCDLELITERYGDDKVLVGNVDLKVLTFGDEEAVFNEVMRCLRTSGHCPGYFINVTGSIPDNVPLGNLEFYFETFRRYGRRPFRELPSG